MSENRGTIRITRATRVEAAPRPSAISQKSADIGLVQRSAGAKPGTRGPHLNLFQGGLPVKKSEPVRRETVAERIAKFAEARKLSEPQAAVFGVIASHVLEHGSPLTDDGFLIAQNARVPYEDYRVVRDRLMNAGIIRLRSVGAIGVDGFDLGTGVNL